MAIDPTLLKNIIEAALLVNGKPQSVKQLEALFDGEEAAPDKQQIDAALQSLSEDFEGRGIELKQVASGYRIQARQELEPWISRLFQEKAPRYSRALLETLALVAYRQPITRSEIEQVRGVSVSSHIMKTLLEREWVRVVGHREVPGRPAMYATTREFLDYFN
ncbi:MAG: SMC-Scp complex subunit ScpB, partial [Gammaproteobacteria bacterium]|nr:SMC-Scp complex subunit ScpB [Gammaproteobacteria bacterium]